MYQPMSLMSDVDWPATAIAHAKVDHGIIFALELGSCKQFTVSKGTAVNAQFLCDFDVVSGGDWDKTNWQGTA